MSGVESVIARSREPGAFSERKRFTIARKQAIRKLRKFALADPHYYILELIQAAIANGALHLDIQIESDTCTLAYIGGGLRKSDLTHLFDYLFASKDRAEVGHLRELAIGINSALLFEPTRVVVESGDGTLKGTTRLLLHGADDTVDIGTPDRPLRGTFVRFEGLKRGRLSGFARFFQIGRSTPRELRIIEQRCLAAPVPILVNGVPLFGFSAQRTPNLYGFEKVVSFDEGDLYGTIGLARSGAKTPDFNLLTWGVSLTRRPHTLIPGRKFGGVVCFDRLRKTVDHSGVVEDERLEEMWLRLGRHANRLVKRDQQQDFHLVKTLAHEALGYPDLRARLKDTGTLVLAPASTTYGLAGTAKARKIGELLGAPVLLGEFETIPALRASSAGSLKLVMPDCSDAFDLDFYGGAPARLPARPWLTHPVDADPLSTSTLVARVLGTPEDENNTHAAAWLTALAGTGDTVKATVFTPENSGGASGALRVELRTGGRLLTSHTLPSLFAGCVLIVDLAEAQANRLLKTSLPNSETRLSEAIARVMASHASSALAKAFRRAARRLGEEPIVPGSALARFGLLAAVQSCVPRLAVRDGRAVVTVSQLDDHAVDLLGLPLLKTHAGRAVSLREVAALMSECGGLCYGTRPDIDATLEGLDLDRILDLDVDNEQMVLSLFGESAYVRIDDRDELASSHGVVCRDLAIGLRPYPAFALLTEGVDVATLDEATRRACLEALTGQLIDLARAASTEPPPNGFEAHTENRRHAVRQLQWLACTSAKLGAPKDAQLYSLPLFLTPDGEPTGLGNVLTALASPTGLRLFYAHSHGASELGHLTRAFASGPQIVPVDHHEIVAAPFVHALLRELGTTHPSFDFPLPNAEAFENASLATWVDVDQPGIRGRIGIPMQPVAHPDIAILLPDRTRARSLSELATEYGCVGWLRLDEAVEWSDERVDSIATTAKRAAESAVSQLLARLRADPLSPNRPSWTATLLAYAGRQLNLVLPPNTAARAIVRSSLAQRVLELPLFDSVHGDPSPALTLIHRFCGLVHETPQEAAGKVRSTLAPDLPPHLDAWLAETLDTSNLIPQHAEPQPPGIESLSLAAAGPGPTDSANLLHTVRLWLEKLSPPGAPPPPDVWLTVGTQRELVELLGYDLYVEESHWICEGALQAGADDPTRLAWLLLAVYAKLNAALEEVTNAHERSFQERLTRALAEGRLKMLQSPGPRSSAYANPPESFS